MKVLFFLLIFSVSITFAQTNNGKIDELLSMLSNQQQFNGSVLIAENGKVTFSKSYGLANEETKQNLNADSIFELASVSKQFTAMGILILSEKNKLNFDDKITKFFPALEEYKEITVRNLVNHTSGLPDYIQPKFLNLLDQKKINTNKDIIDLLVKNKPKLEFEPNTKFAYSNTGYVLLASIIEKVSGKTFAKFLEDLIFKPLKMKRTFVYQRRLAQKKLDNYAFGYVFDQKSDKNILPDNFEPAKFVYYLDGIVGDGNISSTVNDLLKWDRALTAKKLISTKTYEEAFSGAILKDGKKTNYGFGWYLEEDKDLGKIVYHTGSFPGYKTIIERHLTKDKTIILLQNHDNVVLPRKNFREILYNQSITPTFRKQISLTSEQLDRFIGDYDELSDEKSVISITKSGNYLVYNSTNNKWDLRFYPFSEKEFFAKTFSGAEIEFATDEKGEPIIKLLQRGKVIATGKKVK